MSEMEDLLIRLKEAEDTLRAIGSGEVDAFVVSRPDGEQVFTLKGAEHPYRVLVETMNEGAVTLTPEGIVVFSNKYLAEMLRVPLERLIGTPLAAFVAPADQPIFEAQLRKCIRAGERDEITLITGKDESIPVLISCSALDLSGIVGLCLVITDITQQKRNEEFMAAERLARSIIDQAGEVIIVCDNKGMIIRASWLAHQMCAQNPLLRPFDELIKLRSTDSGQDIAILPAAPAKLKNVEVQFKRLDGRIYYFLLNVSPLRGGLNQVTGFIVTLTDITERIKIKEQLMAMNDSLERRVEQRTRELLHAEKLSAIGQFSASIAHEFNNPLQGVLTVLKGLKLSATLTEEDSQLLNAAISESERMKKLIRSLQEFNRPTSDRKVLMDIHSAIDSLLLLCKSNFKQQGIALKLHYAERLPQVLAISDQIKQVFLNLLANAADACRKPGGVITISTWQEDNRVAVAIKDDGVGIDPDKHEQIFQPFFTTKLAEGKGTGLGLSVSYGIVQNHQGEIRVESQPGKGSTFTVLLPINGATPNKR